MPSRPLIFLFLSCRRYQRSALIYFFYLQGIGTRINKKSNPAGCNISSQRISTLHSTLVMPQICFWLPPLCMYPTGSIKSIRSKYLALQSASWRDQEQDCCRIPTGMTTKKTPNTRNNEHNSHYDRKKRNLTFSIFWLIRKKSNLFSWLVIPSYSGHFCPTVFELLCKTHHIKNRDSLFYQKLRVNNKSSLF